MKVGEQVRQVLSEALLQGVVDDERVRDGGIVTITEVRMTPDLRLARAYVSVLSAEPEEVGPRTEDADRARAAAEPVLAGLQSAHALLQGEIARKLKLRYTPQLVFAQDDSIRYGAHMEAVIAEVIADDEGE